MAANSQKAYLKRKQKFWTRKKNSKFPIVLIFDSNWSCLSLICKEFVFKKVFWGWGEKEKEEFKKKIKKIKNKNK